MDGKKIAIFLKIKILILN